MLSLRKGLLVNINGRKRTTPPTTTVVTNIPAPGAKEINTKNQAA